MTFSQRLVAAWYAPQLTALTAALLPLELVFRGVVAARRLLYRWGALRSQRMPVPVVIVGNVVAGGSGKTPLVIALADALRSRGWRPGIVSRGYGGAAAFARAVRADASPDDVGDEPVLLARSGHPVWVGRDRPSAARGLLSENPDCDLIVADDGLQHYALARDVEIAAVDAARGLGNGHLFPAGPLREPASRLGGVDAVASLGGAWKTSAPPSFVTSLVGDRFVRVNAPNVTTAAPAFHGSHVHALAGIGNPQRFFDHLSALGIAATCHAFPDHHRFTAGDIAFPGAKAILMTEKDAVKCSAFADERCWALPVRAMLDPALLALVEEKLSWIRNCSKSSSARSPKGR